MDAPTLTASAHSRWPLLQSASLHGLLLAALLWGARQQGAWAPEGVALRGSPTVIEMLPLAPSAAFTPPFSQAQRGVRHSADALAKPIAAAQAPTGGAQAAPPSTFGVASGAADSGRLGTANGTSASEKERYSYELRLLLESRMVYPPLSRKLKESGEVLVAFEILKDGRIQEVKVKNASRHARLNQAALSLVNELGKYRPLPDSVGVASLQLEMPLRYEVN